MAGARGCKINRGTQPCPAPPKHVPRCGLKLFYNAYVIFHVYLSIFLRFCQVDLDNDLELGGWLFWVFSASARYVFWNEARFFALLCTSFPDKSLGYNNQRTMKRVTINMIYDFYLDM